MENRMELADRIADALKARHMTQKELARKMRKSESEVSECLSGERNFTIDTLSDIEVALGIRLLDPRPRTIQIPSDVPVIRRGKAGKMTTPPMRMACEAIPAGASCSEDNHRSILAL